MWCIKGRAATLRSLLRNKRYFSSIIASNEKTSILQIPMFTDNYSYLLVDKSSNKAAAIDPAQPSVIMGELEKQKVNLTDILTTHHHWDHAGGNEKLLSEYNGNLTVYGGEDKIEGMNKKVTEGDSFECLGNKVEVLSTPCHTAGHIVYFLPNFSPPVLFSGDTLFVAGCGRFFEGTAEQMVSAMEKLSKLPKKTLVCCGHEYTVSNLKFAESVEPENSFVKEKLNWAIKQRENGASTVPSTIGEELTYNPFMRFRDKSLHKALNTKETSASHIMSLLREMKNNM